MVALLKLIKTTDGHSAALEVQSQDFSANTQKIEEIGEILADNNKNVKGLFMRARDAQK